MFPLALPADAQPVENEAWACSGGVRGDVVMAETGETFVVSTIMRPTPVFDASNTLTGYDWPRFEQTVAYEDGSILIRFEAARLLDDVGPLSCEARLNGAQRDLINTISMAKRIDLEDERVLSEAVRIRQLSACLSNPDACGVAPHYVAPSASLRDLGADAFNTIVEESPITFPIFRSAYSVETYLYEPKSRTVVHLETEDS